MFVQMKKLGAALFLIALACSLGSAAQAQESKAIRSVQGEGTGVAGAQGATGAHKFRYGNAVYSGKWTANRALEDGDEVWHFTTTADKGPNLGLAIARPSSKANGISGVFEAKGWKDPGGTLTPEINFSFKVTFSGSDVRLKGFEILNKKGGWEGDWDRELWKQGYVIYDHKDGSRYWLKDNREWLKSTGEGWLHYGWGYQDHKGGLYFRFDDGDWFEWWGGEWGYYMPDYRDGEGNSILLAPDSPRGTSLSWFKRTNAGWEWYKWGHRDESGTSYTLLGNRWLDVSHLTPHEGRWWYPEGGKWNVLFDSGWIPYGSPEYSRAISRPRSEPGIPLPGIGGGFGGFGGGGRGGFGGGGFFK